MSRDDVRLAAAGLLAEASPLELLVSQAVILANLDNRPETLEWYITESLANRLRNLFQRTAALAEHASAGTTDMEGIELDLREAERKLRAVQEIADDIAEEAAGEEGAVIEAEDDQVLANRTFEAFVSIRDALTRLVALESTE